MKITVTKGHLTAGNKRAISSILEIGELKGKIGRTSYFLFHGVEENQYIVKIVMNDRGIGLVGNSLRRSVYTHIINVQTD